MSSLTFAVFRNRFQELVDELEMSWEAVGFLTADGKVYPFGTDTVLSPLELEFSVVWVSI